MSSQAYIEIETSVKNDPEDLEAMTPNHFLLGREGPATPFNPDAQQYTDL